MRGRKMIERFMSKVEPIPESGCWLWTGSTNDKGYGWTGLSGMPRLAHRAAYTLLVAPIPEGMNVCHKCDVRSCVNPTHLFVGSQRDNIRDASAKKRLAGQEKTHCKHGHAFTPENTIPIRPGQRDCRKCRRGRGNEWMRKWRSKKRAALQAALGGKE